ncbi:Retrovirus-related Pol polyprotein from transposon RE1 [Vitis vinifera]|uniref:Retrovirus-related Pol polyprotein from transposon RE1 n=1 Tax=Vitis vinifera TaxID=29760 RepID=A0A438HCV3_VITVI|nr:Retrovirus-related Pol polyprotein from transposon RE1 [Vitis vinifera]
MPSSVLHDQIPHSLLFPDQPLYFLPPRVFGCTCFVHILTPGQDKLSAQSHESLPVSEVLPIPIVSPPEAMPPRPLQVYHRRPRIVAPLPFPEAPADSLPIPSASPAPALPSPNGLPIAVRKGWRQAMVDEMAALHSNGTWDLVVLPPGKSTVGCRWVYAVKVGPDGQIASVRLLLSMAAMCSWPLYQLDIKKCLPSWLRRSLYGLKQSPRAWFSRFSSVIQEFGMLRSTADHSVFYHHNSLGQCIYLVVYVDDIVITGSDQDGIQKLKQHLFTHFQTKDLGQLKYFLGIEIAQSSSGVVLSQRKYALDILEETGMLDCKPVDTPMDSNVKLVPGQGEPLGDPRRYRRLVGKLNYLTITRPDISFPVSVVSQFLQSPCDSHWDAVIRILRYIKSTPGQGVLYENRGHTQVVGYTDADWAGSPTDRRSTSGYCVFIGVLRFGKDEQMKLICDNQAALHIASNPVFHERTKHIEVDCHFIREKIASGCVATSFVNSNDQLADIFTKSLRGPRIKYICNKLGAYDESNLESPYPHSNNLPPDASVPVGSASPSTYRPGAWEVTNLGPRALAISLPFSCVLGLLSSMIASTMVSKSYIWAYASFQFAIVILFAHIFYTILNVNPILSVLLSSFTGFGIAISTNSLLVEYLRWRASRQVRSSDQITEVCNNHNGTIPITTTTTTISGSSSNNNNNNINTNYKT